MKFGLFGDVDQSLLSNGCVINGTLINSVLSPGVRVERGAVVRDSMIMNDTTIKAGAVIRRNCRIDPNVTPDDFEGLEIANGATVTRGQRRAV